MFFKQEAVSLVRFIERLVFDKFCVINLSVLLIPIIHFDNLFFKEYHTMAKVLLKIFHFHNIYTFHNILSIYQNKSTNNLQD